MLNLALNGGILSSIWNGIKSVVSFITNFTDIIKGIFQATIIYAFSIFYYLFMGICSIVNFAEMLFKKFAGIDPIMTVDGEMNILDVFVKSNEIWGLFISILILSIVLLFIFTIVAIIKSEFSLDAKGSAKGPIIARSLKSLAMFIIVPVVSLMGVYATNAITDTINDMFRGSEDSSMVNQIFYVMSYNANKARINEEFANFIDGYSDDKGEKCANDAGGEFSGGQDNVAYQIDQAFKSNKKCQYKYKWIEFPLEMIECQDFSTLFMPVIGGRSSYSIWDITQVNLYYSVLDMDYIVGLGSALVITYMLLSMCVVLIKRIFEIVILLLLAAPMIALAPLDGGSASKSWQKEFIKRVIAIVAPVFAINMYFIMIPLFTKISIFGGGLTDLGTVGAIGMSSSLSALAVYATYDALFQLLAICVGMSVVKTASALLCNLLGIQDLLKEGQDQTKKAVGTAVQVAGMVASGGATAAAGAASMAAGAAKKASQKKLAQAEASGDKDKIAEAKKELDENTKKHEHAKEVAKDKRNAFIDKVVPGEPMKGLKAAKKDWDNRGKSDKDLKTEEEMKTQETKENATKMLTEKKNQGTMRKEHNARVDAYRTASATSTEFDANGADFTGGYATYDVSGDNRANRWGKGGAKTGEAALKSARADYEKTQETYDTGRVDMNGMPIMATRTKAGMEGQADNLQKIIAALEKDKSTYQAQQRTATLAEAAGNNANTKFKRDDLGRAVIDEPERTQIDPNSTLGKVMEGVSTAVHKIPGLGAGAVQVAEATIGRAVESDRQRAGTSTANTNASTDILNSDSAAEHDGTAARRELLTETAGVQVASEQERDANSGMSEQVEKGMKEAAGDLASRIKEALSSGQLPVKGLEGITNQLQALQTMMKNANNDADANAVVTEISKIAAALEKLKK